MAITLENEATRFFNYLQKEYPRYNQDIREHFILESNFLKLIERYHRNRHRNYLEASGLLKYLEETHLVSHLTIQDKNYYLCSNKGELTPSFQKRLLAKKTSLEEAIYHEGKLRQRRKEKYLVNKRIQPHLANLLASDIEIKKLLSELSQCLSDTQDYHSQITNLTRNISRLNITLKHQKEEFLKRPEIKDLTKEIKEISKIENKLIRNQGWSEQNSDCYNFLQTLNKRKYQKLNALEALHQESLENHRFLKSFFANNLYYQQKKTLQKDLRTAKRAFRYQTEYLATLKIKINQTSKKARKRITNQLSPILLNADIMEL